MSDRTDQRKRLRGARALCSACGHLFGSPSAFDRHQRDGDEVGEVVCLTPSEWLRPTGKANRPILVWHPTKHLWVTRLREDMA